MNTVTLVGNAARNPELRFTPSGQGVATFGLAVNRRWQNKQTSAWEESVSFFDVVAWGTLGENVAESVTVITTASPASIRKQSPHIHQLPLIQS